VLKGEESADQGRSPGRTDGRAHRAKKSLGQLRPRIG